VHIRGIVRWRQVPPKIVHGRWLRFAASAPTLPSSNQS
jgi:hypothetical protein